MQILIIVVSVLLLGFGLKVLKSPLFNSMLSGSVEVNYNTILTLGLLAVLAVVGSVKIVMTHRNKESNKSNLQNKG